MNLNFYNPSNVGGPSIDDLQKSLEEQLGQLQKLKDFQLKGNNLNQSGINNMSIDQQINAMNNPPQSNQTQTPEGFYNNFRNLKNWNLFLETVYGLSDDQMLSDYKLFNKALAEVQENESQEKLNQMKTKLKNKSRKITNVSNTTKPNTATAGQLDIPTDNNATKVTKRGGKENVQ